MNLQDVKVQLNILGTAQTAVDQSLGAARAEGVTNAHVVAAHDAIARAGKAAAAIAAWVEAQETGQKSDEVGRSTVVVDVGGRDPTVYTGRIDPGTLTLANWRYWSDHPELWSRAGQVFSKPYRIGDPTKGPDHLYTQGDLANGPRDPGPLAGL